MPKTTEQEPMIKYCNSERKDGCCDKGVWVNGHFYCINHYRVTVEKRTAGETAAAQLDNVA